MILYFKAGNSTNLLHLHPLFFDCYLAENEYNEEIQRVQTT